MSTEPFVRRVGWRLLLVGLLAACGGGSSDGPTPGGNQPPVPVITAPAEGATFAAGDTLQFAGSATDPEDGNVAASGLSWWVELHHDTHTHPFQPETAGGSGSVTIPVRGETSDNIWYRFHLRATDSAGQAVEVTRDVQPRKAQLTLATQPAGLTVTLDGQPVTGNTVVTGVVGLERDLAAADQNANGRRWRFDGWSDGLPASHTIATPSADTVYTATFTDIGAATNQAPTVTLTAPASGTVGSAMTLSASAGDSDGQVVQVQFRDGATSLNVDTTSPYAFTWTPASAGTHTLTAIATDDQGATTTSNAVQVTVGGGGGGGDIVAPTATLTAPADLASGLLNNLTLSATAADNVGVAAVEFQIDGVTVGEDTSAPYSVTVNSNLYAHGQHIVRARARDTAGNLSAWSRATVSFAFTPRLPSGFSKNDAWATGLTDSTAFAQAPDGRIFVCEQGGALRVVKNGALLPTPFHQFTVDGGGERGLLGVAFHPDFATNGWVYVYYTTTTSPVHNRISRVVANGDVSTGTETTLVDLPPLSGLTHNGGALHFGPDGKLYVAVGDNGTGTKASNLAEVFGKVLRFNADATIPSDNPFYATQTGLARAVWAYGLRNPFTFAFQPGTGRMHINDVGQATWEEINVGARGANYGWPSSEGPDRITAGITAPLFAYNHTAYSPPGSGPGGFITGIAISGGAFYPSGGNFPAAYRNSYYFADYGRRWISRLDLDNPGDAYGFAFVSGEPVDVLAGSDGAIYVLLRASIARISAP
ncbi:PQQ-dependent sugar dehydrogenase [Piscinibacter sp. XHJ-5]|uniref:PQQ-dependent sugar dehydrogenase n=1 Tax=Piscinibacter sp. XHJ-5 TaxID=3037797 RepID=UPI002452C01A|nr:PQQ-dependent sugar dehydrogenase [Piscinibacter sp. XHJ-5]